MIGMKALTFAAAAAGAFAVDASSGSLNLVRRAIAPYADGIAKNITIVSFRNAETGAPTVTKGSMSDACKEYLESNNYSFTMPFNREDQFMSEFHRACQNVSFRVSVSQTFGYDKLEGCTGKENHLRFYPNRRLGQVIANTPYFMVAVGVVCDEEPLVLYIDDHCNVPTRSTVFGSWNLTPFSTSFITAPNWGRQDTIVDLRKCTFGPMTNYIGSEERILHP